MSDLFIGKSQKSHICNMFCEKIAPKFNVQHFSFIRGWITSFQIYIGHVRLYIQKSDLKNDKSQKSHISYICVTSL